jgi:hypothetical protein
MTHVKKMKNNTCLTRTFRTTVMERAARDARFRGRLLMEATDQLLTGDLAAGRAMLHDYIHVITVKVGRHETP